MKKKANNQIKKQFSFEIDPLFSFIQFFPDRFYLEKRYRMQVINSLSFFFFFFFFC